MLEGLEITEMKLSEVRKNNEKFRIDGSYFSKTMLRTESIIHAYNNGHDTLGHVFSRFVKGIFDINANSYSGSGIPFLRILNLKNGVVATNNLALIPELIHQAEKKTELLCGDIVLSKTAYPAASLVTLERCNTSQDTIATTLSTFGKSYYFSEFIVAFLNCMYGKLLLTRQFQGNVQLHLALDDGRKVPIPRGTKYLQSCIKYAFKNATEYLSESKNLYAAAETLLLNTLGLADFTPNSEKVNIKSFQESFVKTGRLDAEYYQQKYEQLVEHILKKPHCKLADLVKIKKSIEPGSDAYSDNEEDLPFLRVADYDKFGMNTPQKKLSFVFVTDNQEKINALKPKKGTILFSKDGSIGQAYYLHEDGRFITSGAILHLNIKNKETIVPDYLTLVPQFTVSANASRARCRRFNYFTLAD